MGIDGSRSRSRRADRTADPERILQRMVQIGKVMATSVARKAARVKFEDTGIISDWLRLLGRNPGMPEIDEQVLCLYFPVRNGDGFILGIVPPIEGGGAAEDEGEEESS